MEERAQSEYEMAEIPGVLSSTLVVHGEAWPADVTSRLTPVCRAAVGSKTLVSFTTMSQSM